MLCGGSGGVFLPFNIQGHFPRLALPLLRVGRHRPEQAVGPAIRGEGQRQPWRQAEPVVGGGEAIGQVGLEVVASAAGASHTLQDDGLQGVYPPAAHALQPQQR